MSNTKSQSKAGKAPKKQKLAKEPRNKKKAIVPVAQLPVANFLPERIYEARFAEKSRRKLLGLTVLTISVAFLAYLGSTVLAFSGSLVLDSANLRLSDVKAEQARYVFIEDLEREIRFREVGRAVATSTLVDSRALVRALTKELPGNSRYNSIQIIPFSESDVKQAIPESKFSVKVQISMELADYPSLQLFLNRLPSLKSFSEARLASVSKTDAGITATLTVFFDLELYVRPFEEPLVLGDEVPKSILDQPSPNPIPTPSPTSESPSPESTPIPSPSPSASPGSDG